MSAQGGYEFMSSTWFAALHGIIAERVARVAATVDVTFSVCEVALDPPRHLSPNGASLAWSYKVAGGEVVFSQVEADDVDLKIEGDYAALASLAPLVIGADPAAAEAYRAASEALVAAGRVRVREIAPRLPQIGSFHDAIAALTAA